MVKGNGWLLWLMAIGNQSAQDIDKAIDWRTVARMLNLRNVLQLVDDGFDDGAFAEQETIAQRQQSLFHVALKFGDQLNACGVE